MAGTGETTSTTTTATAPTVRFSDEPEVFYPGEVEKKVLPTGKQRRGSRGSRRERRNSAIERQKTQEDAKIRFEENFDPIKKFADQLTPLQLTTELNRYVSENMEEHGIEKQISGVPNNGQVPFFPISYCNDCVVRIAAYFEGENMAKTILENDKLKNGDRIEQVYIKDVKKLATLFLDMQKLRFYDHVTVEAFNNNAMERGGSRYDIPLSIACLADATENGSGNLYEQLGGKETTCAAFSTGVVMQCGTSELTVTSENNFKTHKQLLEENVDSDAIRSGCSCLKSDGWLMKRVSDENKMERLMQKNKKWEESIWNKAKDWDISSCGESEQEDETEEMNEAEEKEDESKEEVDSDEEAEKYSDEEEREDEEKLEFKFEQPEDVDVCDYRPRNLVQPVEKEEDFDNEHWSDMRTTSSCLALCRHAPSCIVDAINKARILKSLMLVRLSEDVKKGIASTTGEYFTVTTHPENSLIFSLGATVYEALVRQCERKTIAKVYTTVHTVAAPFFRSAPVCHINHQNKYGSYKTFRIYIPGNFSGHYNDTSIGWRSELYSRITSSAAEAECRDKKAHYSFLKDEEFMPWPGRKPTRVEGGIVYDDSGDMSGNYLADGCFGICEEKTAAVIAYANMRNLNAVFETTRNSIGELLMGPFKNRLVELKTLDIKRTQAEEAAAARGGLTAHETQRLNDTHIVLTQNVKFIAQTINSYKKILKSLEMDLGTMNKYLSYNLKGYTAVAATSHKPDINDNVYAYYL